MILKRRPASEYPVSVARLLAVLFVLVLSIGSFEPVISPLVRADDKRIIIEFYPSGDSEKTNPVILSFNGKLYDDASQPELNENSNLPDDEKFLAKVITTNSKGTLNDLVLLWAPEERQDIRRLASDSQLFEANQKAYSNITKSYLKAKIYYGTYIIFIVKHIDRVSGERFKDYPIKKVLGEYFLTNALSKDPVFQYLTTKYINKLQKQ